MNRTAKLLSCATYRYILRILQFALLYPVQFLKLSLTSNLCINLKDKRILRGKVQGVKFSPRNVNKLSLSLSLSLALSRSLSLYIYIYIIYAGFKTLNRLALPVWTPAMRTPLIKMLASLPRNTCLALLPRNLIFSVKKSCVFFAVWS